ncbi:MAG: FecR family protein [Bacteroidales bacterium]
MRTSEENIHHLSLKYFEGNLSFNEEKILFNYLRQDEAHMCRFREWEKEWIVSISKDAEIDKNWLALCHKLNNYDKGEPKNTSMKINLRKIYPYAAVFVLGILMTITAYSLQRYLFKGLNDPMQSHYFVPAGSQSKVVLPDNSVIWLNSGSTLKYDDTFGCKNRTVYMDGEGLFEVTKNLDLPFIVKNEKMAVTVHGTVFNMRVFKEDTIAQVELLEGLVSVDCLFGTGITRLLPGERLIVNESQRILKKERFEVDSYLSWHEGYLAFCDEPLSEIVKELERRFDVKIIIKNERLKANRYYLTFVNQETLPEILEQIQKDENIRVEIKDSLIEIY